LQGLLYHQLAAAAQPRRQAGVEAIAQGLKAMKKSRAQMTIEAANREA
jgi:hypothetical protein